MLTLRPFCNADAHFILHLWADKVRNAPEFYTPMSMDTLESQILGNTLFDPRGLIIAFSNHNAVGFIQASFCPDPSGAGPRRGVGILYSPIIHSACPDAQETAKALILAGEQYLSHCGADRWYVGGCANASPFYTGLYGRVNPEGIYEKEDLILDTFLKLGYHPFGRSYRYQLDLANYRSPVSPRVHEAYRHYIVRKMPNWSAPNWWEANIYRNFRSIEWNVFSRTDNTVFPEPVAGALFHRMAQSLYVRSQDGDDDKIHLFLAYIGVVENHLRMGIGSMMFSCLVNEILSDEFLPVVVYTMVPEEDHRLASFLNHQNFQMIDAVRSFYKINA